MPNVCNIYCEPENGIHAEPGWGPKLESGLIAYTSMHGIRGNAVVVSDVHAAEIPTPPGLEIYEGPWLLTVRFLGPKDSPAR